MSIYVTSDVHFNHSNIIEYCGRPFKTIEEMNNTIITNWNNTVSQFDTVYHLGDFCFGNRHKFEEKLNGNIIHLWGNHDREPFMRHAYLGYKGKLIFMTHFPEIKVPVAPETFFVLCGHVHSRWLRSNVNKVPLINVGVDVWDFRPVKLDDIFDYVENLNELKKEAV